jgi:hypothetical protein
MSMAAEGDLWAQPEAPDTVSSLPGIEIRTSVDRAEIYVGDLVTYSLSIVYDSSFDLVPPPLGANLGAFEVKDYQSDVITRLEDGRIRSDNTFIISTFTTGDYVIPALPVLFRMPDSSRKVLLSEPVPVKVRSLLREGKDSADIKPLKAPYEFPPDLKRYYVWGGVGLALIIALVVLAWWFRRRRRPKEEPGDLRPPWEIASARLALLKEKPLLAEGRFKEYYLELSEIAREYMGRVYELNVLDMTTGEFLTKFAAIEAPDGLQESMAEFLKHADLVKFAKYVPEHGRPQADFDVVYGMIDLVRLDYRERQATMAREAVTKESGGEEVAG